MIESIYNNLFSKGLVTQSFEEFSNGFTNDPNFRQRIVNDFPELTLPKPIGSQPVEEESQEQKYLIDNVPIIGDFIGDLWRSGQAGWKQGSSVGESIDLMNQKFGSATTDEEIQNFITAYNESTNLPTSDEMMDFNKIYEEEGKGIWGFIKGVANNPTIAPQVFVSSMTALARSAVDSEELTAATVGGAAAGSFIPVLGTAGGGLGALATGMESALTFAELLKEKVGDENFTLENVRKVLDDEEQFDEIYQKAVSRGVAIGAIEGLTGGLAGKAATGARRAVRSFDRATGATAGVGVEAVGGGLGEVAGRVAAGQEMDIAEIGFEAIGGTATAPLTIGGALAQKQGQYTINGQKYTGNEFIKKLNTLSPETIRKSISKIKVENDAEASKILDDKFQDSVYDAQIDTKVKDTNDRKQIVKLEKEFAQIKDQTSVSGNIKATEIRNEIKNILGKYGKYYGNTADMILQGGINVHKAVNLSDNLAKTKAFANLLNIDYKEFDTNDEYNGFIDEYNSKNNTSLRKDDEGQILQNTETGEQTILINKEVAAQSDQFTVGQHELLHGLLYQTLKNNDETAINLGKELESYLGTINVETINNSKFKRRLKMYRDAAKKGDISQAERFEEVVTLTSEAMANNELKYDQTILDKIADAIRQFLQKHFNANMELNSGKDVFNFIKDYNKSFESGVLSKNFGRLSSEGLKGKLVNTESGKRINSIVSKNKIADYKIDDADRKRLVNDAFARKGKEAVNEVIPYYLPKIEAVVNQRRDYSLSDLDSYDIAEEKADIIQETAINLTMHALTFDPSKNTDFDAYINSYVVKKFGTAVKKMARTETKVTEAQERKARQQSETLENLSNEATATMTDMFELGSTEQEKLNEAVKKSVDVVLKDMTIGVKPKRSKLDLQNTFRKVLNKEIKKTIKKKPVYQAWLKKNFPTFFNDVNVETLNKRFRGDKSNPDLFVKPTGKRYSRTATSQPQKFEKQPLAQVMKGLDSYFIDVSAQNVNNRKDKIVEEMSNYMAFEAARKITSSPDIFTIIDEIGITKLDEINKQRVEVIVKDTRDVTNIRTKLKMADLTPNIKKKYEKKIIKTFQTYQPIDMTGSVSEIYKAEKKKFLATVPEEDRVDVEAFMSDREYMIVKPQTGLFVTNIKNSHGKNVLDELYREDGATAPTTEEQVKQTTNHAIKVIKSIPPQTLKRILGDELTMGSLTFVGLKDTNMSIDGLRWTLDVNKKKISKDEVYTPELQTDKPYKYGSNANPHLVRAMDALYEHIGKADDKNNKPDKLWDSLGIDENWNFKDYAPINKTSGLIAKISKDLALDSKNNQQEIIDKYKPDILIANANNPKVQAYMQFKFADAYKNSKVVEEVDENGKVIKREIDKASNIRLLQGTTNATASFVKALAKIKYIHVLNGQAQLAPTPNSLWGYIEHLKENANSLIDFNEINLDYVNGKITEKEYMSKALNLANDMEISYNDTDLSVEQLDKKFNKNLGQGDFKLRGLPPKDLDNFINIETGKSANLELAEKMFAMEKNNKLMIRSSTTAKTKMALPSEQMKRFKKYDKALQMANRLNPPKKGISILDFDDTLAKTKSNILYTLPDGTKGEVNATEFAEKASALEKAGAKFDFSEFNEVKRGKKGPFFNKAKELQAKYGNKDMFILTARPQNAAPEIQKFLKAIGLNIKLKNIIGLEDGKPEAKAEFIVDKAAEGYNDFLFADDAVKNTEAVSQVLDNLDIKGKVYAVKQNFRQDLDKKFNKIIAANKGIDPNATFSEAAAKVRGAQSDKFWSRLFVPPSAEDFKGLLYMLVGKGKIGETQMTFLEESLIKPFAKAYRDMDAAKEKISSQYKQLTTEYKDVKKRLLTATGYNNFTFDQAVRVYTMSKNGIEIPGISKRDKDALIKVVKADPNLVQFSDKLSAITGLKEGYVVPTDVNWLASTIEMDMKAINNSVKRPEYLAEWTENKNIIFSEKNLNKLEALYGTSYRSALEDVLYRMETGTNRKAGNSKIVNDFTDWINNATGNIMFLNVRSAILQTISFTNFVNWSDNNPLKYMAAVANFPQFAKDFAMIWNSDFLKQRRKGLQTDVSAAEIVNQAANSKNKVGAMISYILGKGYLPTQMGDSFAICMGGAGLYRNRINTYLKQGSSQVEAETKAFDDFRETSEDAQQSARPDKISQQQAGPLGRFILAFQNTPMQYTRMIKKAALDLANGRGDAKTNISKIVYYGAMQNLIFSSLQNALFALAFDDEEEERTKERYARIANNMGDTILRGTGIYGAAASTLKNIALEFVDQNKKGYRADHAYTLIEGINLSPPIGSKARKLYSATQAIKFNQDEIVNKGFHIDNPIYDAVGNTVSFATNIPLDRALRITDNTRAALDKNNQTWQRIALALGWNKWDVGIERDGSKKKKQQGGIKLY